MSREKFNPPTPFHQLWLYVHTHQHGADGGIFWARGQLGEEELVEALDIDFEPARGEVITVSLVTCEEIRTIGD